MGSSRNPQTANHQETYIRTRDNPYFDGLRKGAAAAVNKSSIYDFQKKFPAKSVLRSVSDIGDKNGRIPIDISQKSSYSPGDKSSSGEIVEDFTRSSSDKWSRSARLISSPLDNLHSEFNFDYNYETESSINPMPRTSESINTKLKGASIRRSYSVTKTEANTFEFPLPQSAASFYNGHSPHMEVIESCETISRLNMFLKATKNHVNAGVPGTYLQAVIGPDVSDVGSVASTILYAFYLSETQKDNQFCTVPVLNMKKADVDSHAELKWILDSCHIEQSSLIFIDEIDLFYYDLFGGLKLVLLNCDRLPRKQEALKEALVEIFNCKKDAAYPWVTNITIGQDASGCSLIAEKFALSSPETLSARGISRLLLAGILLDTGNLTSPQCTSRDRYTATLMLNGAGRFGSAGLYQLLRYKMFNVSDLGIGEILRKEFKKWTRIGKSDDKGSRLVVLNIGMSSIGKSISELLSQDATSTHKLVHFQYMEKLHLLMVVSGYYDARKQFKREILVSSESAELMENLLQFINSSEPHLPLKVLQQSGLGNKFKAFEIEKVMSRRTIERILEEFSGTLK